VHQKIFFTNAMDSAVFAVSKKSWRGIEEGLVDDENAAINATHFEARDRVPV
jgi:transposase